MGVSKAHALVVAAVAWSVGCGGGSPHPNGGFGGTTGGAGTTGAGGSSGCSIMPALTVPWQIVNNANEQPITCATAAAIGLDLEVNGILVDTPVCPASASSGQMQALLGGPGSYTLDVFLVDAVGGVVSEAHPPSFNVACVDTQTPTVILPVNL
jgi:hypothetical protein